MVAVPCVLGLDGGSDISIEVVLKATVRTGAHSARRCTKAQTDPAPEREQTTYCAFLKASVCLMTEFNFPLSLKGSEALAWPKGLPASLYG